MQRLGDTGALKNHVKKQHFKGDNEKVAPSTLHKGAGGKPSTEEKTKSKRLFRELMAVVPEGYEDKEVPSIKKAKTSKAAAKNKTITISSDEDDSEEAQTQPPAISHSKKPKGKEPAMTTMTKETRQSKQSKQPKQTSKVPLNTSNRTKEVWDHANDDLLARKYPNRVLDQEPWPHIRKRHFLRYNDDGTLVVKTKGKNKGMDWTTMNKWLMEDWRSQEILYEECVDTNKNTKSCLQTTACKYFDLFGSELRHAFEETKY